MGRVGAKRTKEPIEESPTFTGTLKKRKTEKRKIELQRVEVPVDPYLKSFCERFGKPEQAIEFLLQSSKVSVKEFFDNYWEKKPLHIEAEKRSSELKKLFSWEDFLKLVLQNETCSQQDKLIAEIDYLFQKHRDDKVESATVDEISVAFCEARHSEKFGVQFCQPQRFIDPLWALVEKLECYFGSLVSCRVSFLPAGVELTRPRYENSEKFVLQIDGSSNWTLTEYKKAPGYSLDEAIDPEDVGQNIMTVTCQVGDVLYVPKGVIVQSTGETDGVYLSFDTYYGLSRAALLSQSIKPLISELCAQNKEIRSGLPIGFLPKANSVSNADYAKLLFSLAESVKSSTVAIPRPEAMIGDFMSYRLPPYAQLSSLSNSELVRPKSRILLRNKAHITWYVRRSTDTMLNEQDIDEEGDTVRMDRGPATELIVISSINNERKSHMMVEPRMMGVQTESFVIGVEFKELLEQLFAAQVAIRVEDLKTEQKNSQTENSVDPLVLVRALCNIGAVEVLIDTE